MKRIRLSILIPLLLILSSVVSSALLFWEETRVANRTIQQAGVDDLNIALTQLQNMLNTQLAADSLEDARLSLSVSASHPGIRTLLLADENNRVLLANRYIWEGSGAAQVSAYNDLTALRVRQTQTSFVSSHARLLSGYYPVTLRLVEGGLGANRVGALFVEYDLAPQLAQSRHNTVVQSSLIGGLMIVVVIAVTIMLHWLVTRRVEKIVEVSKRFAAGDMEARVQLRGRDELAELGHAFDDMADQRKMAQEEVVQLSLQNKLILDSAGEGIYGLDESGRCTFANPAASQLLGYSVGEIIGQSSHALFHHTREDGSSYPPDECPVHAAYRQGLVRKGSDLYWRKDGSSFPVEFVSTPLMEEGEVRGAVVTFRDTTESKRAEEVLRQSEEGLKEAQRIAHLGNWELDLVNNALNWSDEIYRIFEIDPEKFGASYDAFLNAIHPDDRDRVNNAYTKSLETRTPYSIEHRLLMKDGRIKYVYEKCETYYAADGKPLRSVGTVHDITERKQAETELRENEERLALATLHNGVGIWDWNLVTQELIWDDSMYALYHLRREDFDGTEDAWRASLHPDDLRRGDKEVEDALAGVRPFDTEFRVVWPNGEIHHIKAVAKVLRDEQGKPLRMLGTNMDITGLKAAEEKISELNRDLERRVAERTMQLEAANKELEVFSYSVSHDLRAPLRAVDGFSHILLDEYADKFDEEGRHLLSVVRDNAIRMGQLIDDILQFSRSGRLEMSFAKVDMEALAREVLDELLRTEPRPALQVEIGQLPQASGDRAMLHQVFVNLLSNAIKFSSHRDEPRVEVGGAVDGGEVVYFVRDNGAGFDMKYVDKLFGVFQRLHSESEFEGTGIGLAIIKRIVTRHGGRVWAEGEVDKGATLYFTLPVKRAGDGRD